ncbi:hypothetical protein LR48_Vigan86s001900 [Vigna angularis]|uniref:Uncharacterized protein n=1 Tax=Phaseolus angularis TaxID=3914 RepID=A0A0L9T3W9_PHAAN|nr:hypothetical protein LR48_Vigan86s001900 [Vigna angularis]
MLKSQPECIKSCDRVALSGNFALSGSFQVSKSPLRGKTAARGQNGSCASTAKWKQFVVEARKPQNLFLKAWTKVEGGEESVHLVKFSLLLKISYNLHHKVLTIALGMMEENNGRQTLADYTNVVGPQHFNSIARPRVNATNMEVKPTLIQLVKSNAGLMEALTLEYQECEKKRSALQEKLDETRLELSTIVQQLKDARTGRDRIAEEARRLKLEAKRLTASKKKLQEQVDRLIEHEEGFNKALRQAAFLLGPDPLVAGFDIGQDVYDGKMIPIDASPINEEATGDEDVRPAEDDDE